MPLIQKAKKAIRKASIRASFRPWILKNANTNVKQLLWRGKIGGKEIVVKGSRTPKEHTNEQRRRLLAIKNLEILQGKKYELRISKRYPAPHGKRLELYYDLPTRDEVLDIYIQRVSPKVAKLLKKTGLSPHELHEKCEEAFKELYDKQHKLDLFIDTYAGNVLVDVNTRGKIVFTLIDF
ncbi:MAG: hypothetical protein AABW59_00220 [archaeon]